MEKDSYWLIMPEAPEDDGQPTERYFGFLYAIEDVDPITGEVDLSEEPIQDGGKFFDSKVKAKRFLARPGIRGGFVD